MTEGKGLNRRDFLFTLGGAAGAAAINSLGINNVEPMPLRLAAEVQRLEEAGLGAAVPLFLTDYAMKRDLGHSQTLFSPFTDLLQSVANGTLDIRSSELAEIYSGWGTRTDLKDVFMDARAKWDTLTFDYSDIGIAHDSREASAINGFLARFMNTYPYHVLAMPDHVVLWQGGGEYTYSKISITDIRDNLENAFVTLDHEGTHALDYNWQAIKPYLTLETYLKYVTQYLKIAHETIVDIATLSLEEAMRCKPGPKPPFAYDAKNEEYLHGYEWHLGIRVDTTDIAVRFSRLIWGALQMRKDPTQIPTDIDGKPLFADRARDVLTPENMAILMNQAVGEILHYHVGPPQGKDGTSRLPFNVLDIENLTSPFTLRNIQMHLVRTECFGIGFADPTQDPFTLLRKKLGLSTEQEINPQEAHGSTRDYVRNLFADFNVLPNTEHISDGRIVTTYPLPEENAVIARPHYMHLSFSADDVYGYIFTLPEGNNLEFDERVHVQKIDGGTYMLYSGDMRMPNRDGSLPIVHPVIEMPEVPAKVFITQHSPVIFEWGKQESTSGYILHADLDPAHTFYLPEQIYPAHTMVFKTENGSSFCLVRTPEGKTYWLQQAVVPETTVVSSMEASDEAIGYKSSDNRYNITAYFADNTRAALDEDRKNNPHLEQTIVRVPHVAGIKYYLEIGENIYTIQKLNFVKTS